MMTIYGELPVIGTLTGCKHTKTGWRGIEPDGAIHNVTYRPGSYEARNGYTARMPEENLRPLKRKRTRTRGRVHS